MADTMGQIGNRNIPFRGKKLAFHTVTSLLANKTDQFIIFGGLSAGGRGSMVTIDNLKKMLHPSNTLIGLHDSGNYVDIPPLDENYDAFMVQCQRAFQLYNYPDISEKCKVNLTKI